MTTGKYEQQRSEHNGKPVAVAQASSCFCNRDFTVDDLVSFYGKKKLFSAKNCPLPQEQRNIELLTRKLNYTMNKFGINTCLRKAHFLAQIEAETLFATTEEYSSGWDYDNSTHEDGHKKYVLFKKDPIKYATYEKYKRNFYRYEECIAHGHNVKGFGPKYKGRGLIQLTWKDNYEDFFKKLKELGEKEQDISNPYIVAKELHLSCLSAGWYWRNKSALGDLNKFADEDDLIAISAGVNGGSNGFEHRKVNVKKIIKLMKIRECCNNLSVTSIGTYKFKNSNLYKNPRWRKIYEKKFIKYDD
ncbi:putative chitinase [Cricetibacter osteomyelitidis]|uniref:Putative chitinase n=1 Tax=Cricetibacter osteomyelitidis TaxID=1521931 RepID=A0A4R2SPY3_9PAST|nr:hypothetical protein [Cricetibacter osteomyelitidis]TCP91300.1 putative chitinase [Cricetibacter osteomyelitidis]